MTGRKWVLVLACVACTGAILYYGRAYHRVNSDSEARERWIVPARIDQESVSDIGYVREIRDEVNFSQGKRRLIWWIKVPSTNKIYSCSWESGYRGFRRDDAVEIIHKSEHHQDGDYSGFIVGLHGSQKGRSAAVWAVDEEELELSVP